MKWLREAARCLVEAVYPERCILCERGTGEGSLTAPGPVVAGLRPWDRPHLCRRCLKRLGGPPRTGILRLPGGAPIPVHAGVATHGDLVTAVGAWKYRGLRGLAWPLHELAAPAVAGLLADVGTGPLPALVPLPLHRLRHSERGFNQAEVLARLLALRCDLSVRGDLVRRSRVTRQQASIDDDRRRAENVRQVFAAVPPSPGAGDRLVLVDDLVTSGATAGACAATLVAAGWKVVAVLCLGLAVPSSGTQVDRGGGRF